MSEVVYLVNKATESEIAKHLMTCEQSFVPPLSQRIEIDAYAKKIANKAVRFEAWVGNLLVGLVAAYCNDLERQIAYITSVSVLSDWAGQGIAGRMVAQCVNHVSALGFRQVHLEVDKRNASAVKLYKKNGFFVKNENAFLMVMSLQLESGE